MRTVVAAIATLAVACAVGPRPKDGALDNGKEAIYRDVSLGRLQYADEALKDVWDIGARAKPIHIAPITWTEDPYDSYWRFIFYSLRPTSNLLWAYYATHDSRYRDKLIEVMRSYAAFELARPIDNDPAPETRTTFDNRHTTAWRAMVLVNTYFKLQHSHDLPDDLERDLKSVVHKLGAFMADAHNFEPGQNHGVNEAAALLTVAVNFPEFDEASAWQALGTQRLGSLLDDTIDPDGVEVENSPFYHFYVLSFMYQIDHWGQTYGVTMPDQLHARTEGMVLYGSYIAQPDGSLPLLGSSVAFDVRNNASTPVFERIGKDDETFEYVISDGHTGAAPDKRAVLFPISGQAMLRSGFGDDASFLTFNVGPQRTNHSHADALALTYFASGKSLLPDSGLYTYDAGDEHDYYWSTRAHNTIVVDGLDQPAEPNVDAGASIAGDGWAYQSGAQNLFDGVHVERAVVLLGHDVVVVIDRANADVPHDFAQTWHVAADAQVQASGLDVVASGNDGPELAIHQAFDGATLATINGQLSPKQGWYSNEYGHEVPSNALEYHAMTTAARFATVIASGSYVGATPHVAADLDSGTITVVVCIGDVQRQIAITGLATASESVAVTPAAACP